MSLESLQLLRAEMLERLSREAADKTGLLEEGEITSEEEEGGTGDWGTATKSMDLARRREVVGVAVESAKSSSVGNSAVAAAAGSGSDKENKKDKKKQKQREKSQSR